MTLRPAILLCALLAALAVPTSAQALPAGMGVAGTLNLSWGGISGAPITAWDGSATIAFQPGAAARSDVAAASKSFPLGEAYSPPFVSQVQAAMVTGLSSSKTETVTCSDNDTDGNPITYTASYTSTVASIADGRMAFEITAPSVDLIAGTGNIYLQPYIQGNDGWYIRDRLILPGRWNPVPSVSPCPGAGAPADRLPRIMSPNGGGAIPVNYTDWLRSNGASRWTLKRADGRWKVLLNRSRRDTFSESRFGEQTTQQINMKATSNMHLVGNLSTMGAWCRVPKGRIQFSRSATIAVRWAKKAGMPNTTYGGVKRSRYVFKPSYQITGPAINSMGYAPCGKGVYKIHRVVPL